MKIDLDPAREAAVTRALRSGRWESPEAFVAELLDTYDAAALSRAEQERVGELVDEAEASGPARETTPAAFVAGLRERLAERRASDRRTA